MTTLVDLRRGPDGELYAVSFGQFTEQGPVPNSGAVVRVREGSGSEEAVTGLRNTPNGWKLYREVASPDLPPNARLER